MVNILAGIVVFLPDELRRYALLGVEVSWRVEWIGRLYRTTILVLSVSTSITNIPQSPLRDRRRSFNARCIGAHEEDVIERGRVGRTGKEGEEDEDDGSGGEEERRKGDGGSGNHLEGCAFPISIVMDWSAIVVAVLSSDLVT